VPPCFPPDDAALMPLNRTLIDVPIAGGLQQKQDPRYEQTGAALQMTNCRRLKNNAVQKRQGHLALAKTANIPGGGPITSAMALMDQGGAPTLAQANGRFLAQYSQAAGVWNATGFSGDFGLLDQIHVASIGGALGEVAIESATNGAAQYIVVALTSPQAISAPTLYTTVLDAFTGATVMPLQNATIPSGPYIGVMAGMAVRLVTCGTNVVMVWAVATPGAGAGDLIAAVLDMTQPTLAWSVPVKIATINASTNLTVSVAFDAQPIVGGDGTKFVVAYPTVAAGALTTHLEVWAAPAITLVQSKTQAHPARNETVSGMACYYHLNEACWIAYLNNNGNGIFVWGASDTAGTMGTQYTENSVSAFFTPVSSPTRISVERVNATDMTIAWSTPAASITTTAPTVTAATFFIQVHNAAGTLSFPNPRMSILGVMLAAKPVAVSSSLAYVLVATPSLLQGTQFLVALDWWGRSFNNTGAGFTVSAHRAVATFAPRQWKQALTQLAYMAVPRPIVSGTAQTLPIFSATSAMHSSMALQTVDSNQSARFTSCQYDGKLVFTGAQPMVSDSNAAVELGYAWYPEVPAPNLTGAAGVPAGTYSYIFIFEWYDATGNIHWSATSPPVSVTVPSPQNVNFALPALGVTLRNSLNQQGLEFVLGLAASALVYIVPYRTTNGGTVYYRAVSDPPPGSLSAIAGNVASLSPGLGGGIPYADTLTDAQLTAAGTQLLYTTGGALDKLCPPGKSGVVLHKNRLWLYGGGQAIDLWPSEAITQGIFPGFNEQNVFICDGSIKAACSMDDKLVLFILRGSEYAIEYITGDGPNNIGAQSDWLPPQPVPSGGIGCNDVRALCATPSGILFFCPVGGKAGKGGWWLLTRDLQVQYVGAPVEDLVAANPFVTSCVLHPLDGRVYIWMGTSDTTINNTQSGMRLVWDYVHDGVWSQDIVPDTELSWTAAYARGACASGTGSTRAYFWMTPDGRVFQETVGASAGVNSYTDAGTWVTMKYQTANIQPTLAGFARFWSVQVLGDSLDPHDLTVTLTFDNAPASYYNEPFTWTAAQIAAFDRYPQEDVQAIQLNQKAKSMSITVTDGPPTGGAAVTSQGFSLAGFSIEVGVEQGKRYANLPAGQRG
jgi:hypothetical protein